MQPQEFTLNYFLKVGILTGSRAFGVAKPDSDWDIIIEKSMFQCGTYIAPWECMPDWHVCIDFEAGPGADDADGVEDTEYVHPDTDLVWGQELLQIVKIWNNEEDETECINLFIYENNTPDLFDKFRQINATMNFTLSKNQLADRDKRVERFKQCLLKYGITKNTKEPAC